ncbi:hypothetical protein GCM10010232_44220 [Streptomyces amakusaensis]|uniref:Secreted protein n=1 Tax=Streptomyces amakusaensis TaxID=67271 RepID=A0ABW0AL95_9ACTN
MRQRVRLLVSTSLPPLLLGVWAVFLVLAGSAPAAATGAVASASSVAPVVPNRTDAPSRAASLRAEVRRAPSATVQEVLPADPGSRPPLVSETPGAPAPFAYAPPPGSRESAGPRQERAPPRPVHGPRHTRGPPSPTSS